jgi:AcrR family transcriptional regulator
MDVDPSLRQLSMKEEVRQDRILADAQCAIARFGLAAITFTNLAAAINVAPATMRRHFTDLDALVAEIMRRHLRTIAQAIGAVPHGAPDRKRHMRAAYIEATRCLGAPTEAHLILTRHRSALAEDERISVDDIRAQLATTLGGDDAGGALDLLDCFAYSLEDVEAMLAAVTARRAQAQAEPPAPPPPIEPGDTGRERARLSNKEIPGGPSGEAVPGQPTPRDPPARSMTDEDLKRAWEKARAPPGTLAA